MAVEAIEHYLYNILTVMLNEYGVSSNFTKQIINTIKTQIYSCIQHWSDISFRKALLLLGYEEGLFYEPAGKLDIKCFVVATIRNSPLETAQSDNFGQAGLSSSLSDGQVKEITGKAISYFNALNFEELSKAAKEDGHFDFYGVLAQQYPVSWTALQRAATSVGKKVVYTRVVFEKPFIIKDFVPVDINDQEVFEAVFDGYSCEIDPELTKALHNSLINNYAFTADCFKMVTRNIKKLLQIMEFLLTHERAFVTSNYYIENGYIERRNRPLKAAHNLSDMIEHYSQTSDLGHKHAKVLKEVYSKLRANTK
ncbi:hypothetical protein [Faecalispora sporosphaeroides]|uniref:hypothetical protein n=1 Tax=Faecalispora sporosphaeroides TaxID=1549 RepID=UPI000380A8A2|nr:hypothetical protein [Faecalispora sporosphaeroides]